MRHYVRFLQIGSHISKDAEQIVCPIKLWEPMKIAHEYIFKDKISRFMVACCV